MAGTSTDMSKIKQLLRYLLEGKTSNRKIAKIIGLNKETVNNYANRAKADSLPLESLLALDDQALEHRFKGGAPAYPDEERFKEFQKWLPTMVGEMARAKKTHVTLKLLYEEYCSQVEHPYSMTQFRFHYRQNVKASARKPSTVLKDTYEPGLLVYIDFAGDKMRYVDIHTGEEVPVEVFVATFPYSDYGFALAVRSQSAEDLAFALCDLFKSVGGVPHIIVPDNLKSGVDKADRYAPKLNDLLNDLANHYGCLVEPARVRHPQDKALVENSVKLTYQRAYAPCRNQTFYSLEEVNRALKERMLAHNQKRMSQYDHTREECFLANEKPRLRPLPSSDYEVKRTHELTVPDSCLVYLSTYKKYYSVPYQWVGFKVKVVVTRSIVRIYAKGECIATHQRDSSLKWVIDEKHFPEKSAQWRGRSKEWFIQTGRNVSWALGDYIAGVFEHSGTCEQCMYKTCDALLHLGRNTPPAVLAEAIATAQSLGKYSYKFLENLTKNIAATGTPQPMCARLSPPAQHAGLRGQDAFK